VPHRAAGYGTAADQNAALGVDARISIVASGTNLVGDPHTFTVTVEKNDGSGYGPAANVTVSTTEVGVGSIDLAASTCDDSVTDGAGQCVVVVTSTVPGTSRVDATVTVAVEGVVGPVDVYVDTAGYGAHVISNTKTWVDARITLVASGPSAVDVPYEFTVTVEKNDGTGWAPANGIAVNPSLTAGVGGITGGTCDNTAPDTVDGQCTIIVNSSVAGSSTVDATARVFVGGVGIDVSTSGYGAHDIDNVATWIEPPPP
jgi:hypothetical protein